MSRYGASGGGGQFYSSIFINSGLQGDECTVASVANSWRSAASVTLCSAPSATTTSATTTSATTTSAIAPKRPPTRSEPCRTSLEVNRVALAATPDPAQRLPSRSQDGQL